MVDGDCRLSLASDEAPRRAVVMEGAGGLGSCPFFCAVVPEQPPHP